MITIFFRFRMNEMEAATHERISLVPGHVDTIKTDSNRFRIIRGGVEAEEVIVPRENEFGEVANNECMMRRGKYLYKKLCTGCPGPIVGIVDEIEDHEAFAGSWGLELIDARLPMEYAGFEISQLALEKLKKDSFVFMDDLVPQTLVDALRKECNEKLELSEENHGQSVTIRGDKVDFVDFRESDDLAGGFRILEGLAEQIQDWDGRKLLLPPQGMVAWYPGNGTRYVRHLDNQRDSDGFWTNHRVLTTILYLGDSDWDVTTDGGELQVEDLDGKIHVLSPKGGNVAIFDSRKIWHQVNGTRRRNGRIALSTWFVSDILLRNDPLPPRGDALQSKTKRKHQTDNKTTRKLGQVKMQKIF